MVNVDEENSLRVKTSFSTVNRRISEAPVWLWLALRLASVVIALLAGFYATGSLPDTEILRNKYDVRYYARIVEVGYLPRELTANFHPLYPWISSLVFKVLHDPFLSLLLVSSAAGLALTIVVYQLALLDTAPEKAWMATALLLCWPASVALFVPYTESLFLLLAALCLFMSRKRYFWTAGLFGGLAALTRQHGLFLVVPLAWEIWQNSDSGWRERLRNVPSLLLIPLGYAFWAFYRLVVIGDTKPDFSSFDGFMSTVMTSPASRAITRDHEFMMPWSALWNAVRVLPQAHLSAVGNLVLGAVFVIALLFAWKHLRPSYRIYCLVITLVGFSFYTGQLDPYMGLPRHLLPAFPVFIGVVQAYEFKRPAFVLIILAVVQMLFLCCFVWQTWVL